MRKQKALEGVTSSLTIENKVVVVQIEILVCA